jgi:hypothetical protein
MTVSGLSGETKRTSWTLVRGDGSPWAWILMWVNWILLLTTLTSATDAIGQTTDRPTNAPGAATQATHETETIKIRRLYVPEDHLVEFMQERPTYLPLSAAKFQEMIAGIQPVRSRVVAAQPLRHWIVTSPGGSVQGYSLVRGRPLLDDATSDPPTLAWLSFDDWKIPADYFNLVRAPVPATALEGNVGSLGWSTLTEGFTEVPAVLSVNEQGSFGLPLAQAESFMLVRYNLTLATQAEGNLYRQLRLPNTPGTIAVIRSRVDALQPFQVNGTLLRVQDQPKVADSVDSQAYEHYQVLSDAAQLVGQFSPVERAAAASFIQGRYYEQSTVTIRHSVANYETTLTVEFHESVRGDLVMEVPPGLELRSCEVNGQTQAFTLSSEQAGVRQLRLPWQTWGVNNRIRLVGEMPPPVNGRISLPRISLPGHTWLTGNVQASVESPLSVRDYELINSRLIRCQELGQDQSLSFQWGSPESSVTLLLDTAATYRMPKPLKSPDIVLLTADQESLEADQYLLLDNRWRDSNVLTLAVADPWQVEQVALVDLRQLSETSVERVPESSMTPLPWLPSTQEEQRKILVTLPTDPKESSLAIRVRAVRPANQWPLDVDCQVVSSVSPSSGTPAPPQPCLVSLRGTAGIQEGNSEASGWTILTNEEARRQVVERRGVLGAGSFRYSETPARLTLQNKAELTGSYDVLAYTRNQLSSTAVSKKIESNTVESNTEKSSTGTSRPKTSNKGPAELGILRQWHRLLIQPSGPVYEIELASTRSTPLAGRWSVVDAQGHPVPFEANRVEDSDRWRVRFPKPLSDSVSVCVEQEWIPESEGNLLLYFAPKARSFAGVIDTRVPNSTAFQVAAPPVDLTERSRMLYDFRMSSRQRLATASERNPTSSEEPAERLLESTSDARVSESEDGDRETFSVYLDPQEVRFNHGPELLSWTSAMVTKATQIDTWQRDGWSTRLTLQVFSEGAAKLIFELPAEGRLSAVLVDQAVIVPNAQDRRIEIDLSGRGMQTLVLHWNEPARATVADGSGFLDLPNRSNWLRKTKFAERYVCLPNEFSLTAAPDETVMVQAALSRRLVSPLVGSLGLPTSPEADLLEIAGWTRVVSPVEHAPALYRSWRQDLSIDAAALLASDQVRVWDHASFTAFHWLVLVLGSWIAIGLSVWPTKTALPWRQDPRWWLGGGCLALALGLPWPYYPMASTLLLGLFVGCSWIDLWRALQVQSPANDSGPAGTSFVRNSRSNNGLRTLPSSLWFWVAWLGCYAGGALWDLRAADASETFAAIEPATLTERQDLKPSAGEPNRPHEQPYDAVVIPIDAAQTPSDKVVYLAPELYQRLTNLSSNSSSIRDLEIRNAQHTLEYDSQLQRFSRLTTQYSCRTQADKTYRVPATANVDHLVRQVRVNGLPVLFQRRERQIEVALEAGTSLLSISYDLQSVGSAMDLSVLGTSDSYLVLNGVPSGWQTTVTDQENPNVRFRSPIQRRFRMDRIRRLLIEVQREASDVAAASVETWLNVQPQGVQCELRIQAGLWAKLRPEWLFQVDSRLSLPTGFRADSATWTLETLPEAEKPRDAKTGPVYRIRFSEGHSTNQVVRIPWEYSGRSFGGVIPPRIEFLNSDHLRVRKWVVLRVSSGLVYRPAELAQTTYRRGSTFELQGISESLNGRNGIVTPSNNETANSNPTTITPTLTDTFVYEELSTATAPTQSIVGHLSLQPTQVSGVLGQTILLSERSATIELQGELQVTGGELSQIPIRLPSGAKLQRLVVASAAQGEVAWTVRSATATHDSIVVFLRTPMSGDLRLELLADVSLSAKPGVPFVWARLLTPLDLSQTLKVHDSTASWKLRSLDQVVATLTERSLLEPQTFVVSADSFEELDRMELIRQQPTPRVPNETNALGRVEPAATTSTASAEPNRPSSADGANASTSDGAGLEQGSTGTKTLPSKVAILGSRVVLAADPQSLPFPDPGTEAGHRRIEGVQQFLLRTQYNRSVTLMVPAGVEVRRAWVDRRPVVAWAATSSRDPNPAASTSRIPDQGAVAARVAELGLDPLEEFSMVTLQLSWERVPETKSLGLIEVSDAGTFPIQVDGAGDWEWPLELVQTAPAGSGPELNLREIYDRKIANWTTESWAGHWPSDHPLLTIAARAWPDPTAPQVTEGRLTFAPAAADGAEDVRPLNPAIQWDWATVLAGMFAVWVLGAAWPRRLPTPTLWGDFGWFILALGVWLGGASLWLVLLFGTFSISFLLLRLLRSGFSWRFA